MKRFVQGLATIILVAVVVVFAGRILFPLPDVSSRTAERAIAVSADTVLGARMGELQAQHPALTGVIPLQNGHDALASRLELAAAAQHSIDAQYYIWHDDTAGIMLLDALNKAAQRGVRVRLLLDDNGIPGFDQVVAALNAQENFSIRLFNPSTIRKPKLAGYAIDFMRMNRRMHNKSFIVDGAAAIVGGRNIGDEYFYVGEAFYVDLDVLATGKIVAQTTEIFDEYWNSASVFEVENIIKGAGDMPGFEARVADVLASEEATTLVGEFQNSVAKFSSGTIEMEWTQVQVVADDPVKGEGIAKRDQLMIARLGDILGDIENQLDLVSAYFVPGDRGAAYFMDLAKDGKEVRILTNALNTTDVLMVHAGYSKYRRELLEAGVNLYELKLRGQAKPGTKIQAAPLGLSGASLHAKTFAIDKKRIFIGSFNFDPRSAQLNCEMGFLIDSPNLATRMSNGFNGPIKYASYLPQLTPNDKMVWQEPQKDGEMRTYQEEPEATWFQQIAIVVIAALPIEWML